MKRNMHIMVFALGAVVLLLGGCVMSEKSEAEKGRALNFQRLLAQEEKRTGELDSELKRVKREYAEMEARNRELSAQLQAVREQLGRVQEETTALREAAALREQQDRSRGGRGRRIEKSAPSTGPRGGGGSGRVPAGGQGESFAGSADGMPAAGSPGAMDQKADSGVPRYHEVKPGETLFRLAKQYGVNVETIRHWNHLQDDVIEVGQKLVVGYE
jgi:TolA-binding protein